ncbi:hypothetical protein C6P40_000349 [Pichia californica]|uniref:NADH-ubiquinone oxidoreductase subunit n=1 Tax=Pichia californica TaxID=460514 RepID=A0A9P7BG87_9ASCO|nr:hypothetical protein C6P42_000358 [[Candida] californica]KAG0688910.1 hypothetical protein C6P40_000349 [[Candida] californica]
MSKYEVIDQDPTFSRVVNYFRPSDYLTWLGATIAGPVSLILLEKYEPASGRQFKMPKPMFLRAGALIGFTTGFFLAYNESTKRFWGVSENKREVEKDRYEIKSLLSKGKNPYGCEDSTLTPYMQDLSARYSKNSQVLLGILPWFNFVNHPYHGVDLKKYYEVRDGEDKWGFDLVPLDQIKGLP